MRPMCHVEESIPMRLRLALVPILVAFAALPSRPATGCTNILVTKGASVDGSTLISYSADSHSLYGELPVTPARRFPAGAERDVVEWDTGKFLGRIPEAPATYSVVGNINEHQVAVGETTFTGRKELEGPSGILDYGSLMWIALERARTAREAVQLIGDAGRRARLRLDRGVPLDRRPERGLAARDHRQGREAEGRGLGRACACRTGRSRRTRTSRASGASR